MAGICGSGRCGRLRRPERRARACSVGRSVMISGEVSGLGHRGRQAGVGAAYRIVKVSLFRAAGGTGPSKVRVRSTMRAVLMAESPIPQTSCPGRRRRTSRECRESGSGLEGRRHEENQRFQARRWRGTALRWAERSSGLCRAVTSRANLSHEAFSQAIDAIHRTDAG